MHYDVRLFLGGQKKANADQKATLGNQVHVTTVNGVSQ